MRRAPEFLCGACLAYAAVVACGRSYSVAPEKESAQAGEPSEGGRASAGGGRDAGGGKAGSGSGGDSPGQGGADTSTGGEAGVTDGAAGAMPGGASGEGSGEGVAGEAGGAGEACQPVATSLACHERSCGTASDGCGGLVECGTCDQASLFCNDLGHCQPLPECDCDGKECGRLPCATPVFCGPDDGRCGLGEICGEGFFCFRSSDVGYCGSFNGVCSGHPDPGCRESYNLSCPIHAISLTTGEPCGSMPQGPGADDVRCGPGWVR